MKRTDPFHGSAAKREPFEIERLPALRVALEHGEHLLHPHRGLSLIDLRLTCKRFYEIWRLGWERQMAQRRPWLPGDSRLCLGPAFFAAPDLAALAYPGKEHTKLVVLEILSKVEALLDCSAYGALDLYRVVLQKARHLPLLPAHMIASVKAKITRDWRLFVGHALRLDEPLVLDTLFQMGLKVFGIPSYLGLPRAQPFQCAVFASQRPSSAAWHRSPRSFRAQPRQTASESTRRRVRPTAATGRGYSSAQWTFICQG